MEHAASTKLILREGEFGCSSMNNSLVVIAQVALLSFQVTAHGTIYRGQQKRKA